MGKRGPAAAPTALKLVKGTRKDRINDAEPQPCGEVVMPAWLEGDAVEVWNDLAPKLLVDKILTSWDLDAFAGLCAAIIQNRRAFADLEENGNRITVVERELANGTLIFSTTKNPAWQVAKESMSLIVTVGGRFGLNPSDRQALKVTDAPSANPKERLLSS